MKYLEQTFEIGDEEISIEPSTNRLGSLVVIYIPVATFLIFLYFRHNDPEFVTNYVMTCCMGIALYYLIRFIFIPEIFFNPKIPIEDIDSVEVIDYESFKNTSRYWKTHFLSGLKERKLSKVFLIHRRNKHYFTIGFTPLNYTETIRALQANGIKVVERN